MQASQVKTVGVIARRLAVVVGILGNVPAKDVKTEDLEQLKRKLATEVRTVKLKDGTERPITRKPPEHQPPPA